MEQKNKLKRMMCEKKPWGDHYYFETHNDITWVADDIPNADMSDDNRDADWSSPELTGDVADDCAALDKFWGEKVEQSRQELINQRITVTTGDVRDVLDAHEDDWTMERRAEVTAEIEEILNAEEGWSSDYYELPEGAEELQDLIEHKDMNFSVGNIFKAAYRMNDKGGAAYNLRKIIWFSQRELRRIEDGHQ